MHRARVILVLPIVALGLLLPGCSSSDSADSTAAPAPSAASSSVAAASSVPADSSTPDGAPTYRLGELHLDLPAADAVALLGEPDTRTPAVEQAADGLFVSTWTWAAKGLVLVMAAESATGPQTVSSITAAAPSDLRTGEGIGIGSAESDVMTAYDAQINTEESGEGSFVVGSVYGGMIFEMANGKVLSIFIGAAAE